MKRIITSGFSHFGYRFIRDQIFTVLYTDNVANTMDVEFDDGDMWTLPISVVESHSKEMKRTKKKTYRFS